MPVKDSEQKKKSTGVAGGGAGGLPFCPGTQSCRRGWGWPLVGCRSVYYNLLQAFSEISSVVV